MRSDSVLAFIVVMTIAFGAIGVLLPMARAMARRIERSRGEPDEVLGRIAELEQRLAETDVDRQRIADLEERLDFTERMLTLGNAAPPKEIR